MAKKTKYDYLPNREIESVITKGGKRIKRKGLLDGAYVRKGYLAKGGKIQYDYLPNREIESIITKGGKRIKRRGVLDGAYVRKGYLANGDIIASEQTESMVLSYAKEISHHANELNEVLANEPDIPIWVLTKLERASTDLSDVTHYLDGLIKYDNGGDISVSPQVDHKKYVGILGDYDKDGLPNADDPKPLIATKKAKKSIEQLKFSQTFENLLDKTDSMYEEMNEFVEKLKKERPQHTNLYARTKTPYSILNKLIETRLLDENKGLKDVVGTTLTFETEQELFDFADKVRQGKLGTVIEYEDMYQQLRKDGYRAIHVVIEQNGVPIELQLKTKRQKMMNEITHDLYKKKKLDAVEAKKLSEIVLRADGGDRDAINTFAKMTNNPARLKHKLTLK